MLGFKAVTLTAMPLHAFEKASPSWHGTRSEAGCASVAPFFKNNASITILVSLHSPVYICPFLVVFYTVGSLGQGPLVF